MMWGSYRAELTKLVRRPATWLLAVLAWTLSLLFTYVFPYAGSAEEMDRPLAEMLPAELVGNSIAGLPVFFGAIMVILGVLVVGAEYGWGTWKTVLVQGPSRMTVYAGKLLVLAVASLGIVLGVFLLGAAASASIAAAESQPLDWPGVVELTRGIGAGWLIALMWAVGGGVLGIALRGVALSIGLGLVWMLAVQQLLSSIAAPLLSWVETLQKGLPSPNAGALVVALGASTETPGAEQLVGGGQAALVVAVYLLAFAAIGGVLLQRRDIL